MNGQPCMYGIPLLLQPLLLAETKYDMVVMSAYYWEYFPRYLCFKVDSQFCQDTKYMVLCTPDNTVYQLEVNLVKLSYNDISHVKQNFSFKLVNFMIQGVEFIECNMR